MAAESLESFVTALSGPGMTALVGAVVGGLLAFLGTLLGQAIIMLNAWRQRRREHAMRQRERLERMSDAVGATLEWFSRIGRCHGLEELRETVIPAEVRKVVMLANLYFPSLVKPAGDWGNTFVPFYHLAVNSLRSGHPASVGALMVQTIQSDPSARKIDEDTINLRLILEKAMTEEAKKYRDG